MKHRDGSTSPQRCGCAVSIVWHWRIVSDLPAEQFPSAEVARCESGTRAGFAGIDSASGGLLTPMVAFSALPAPIRSAFDRITPLAFGIVGKSLGGGEPWAVGSGVFIAPYVALTARHVVEATWKEFEPEWKKNRLPKGKERATHSLVLTHKFHAGRPETAAWRVEEAWPATHTDLSILRVSPHDEMAANFQWRNGFLNLQLIPPAVGSKVYVFGYPESRAENDTTRENTVTGNFQIKIFPATVTKVEDYRRDRALTKFPGFEFTPGVEGGSSGGPVFFEDRLCGIVSSGGLGCGADVGYAAALWPLIFRAIRFGIGEPATMLELMKTNLLHAVDLAETESRAYLDLIDDGDLDGPKLFARLRPAVAQTTLLDDSLGAKAS